VLDETNVRIEEMKDEIRRENHRRNSFYRMVQASDRVLWRLEEMNRDGVKEIPEPVREEFQGELDPLPPHVKDNFRNTGQVQETLDSLFEMQEALFKWRNPEFAFEEDDDLERAS
jgi:hypothetical protein